MNINKFANEPAGQVALKISAGTCLPALFR
jgi:hypothetical protein